jgi:hypothetical protein
MHTTAEPNQSTILDGPAPAQAACRTSPAGEDRRMATFVIHTHGRLQEWVAEENGYFAAEGLTDYILASHGLLSSSHARAATLLGAPDNRHGAYRSY